MASTPIASHRSSRTRTARLLRDAGAIALPLVVGGAGGAVTADRIPTWYRTLGKPPWNPPDAVFAPVWTTLYVLMGVALVLVRRAADDMNGEQRARADRATAVFGLQLALNLAWSLAFFGGRSTTAGLAVIGLLWGSIVATIREYARVDRRAAALLLPYLGWVSFATVLNLEIWRLNHR